MLEILLYALPLALTLSFAAGPVFFVVIETSISKSRTKALVLDLGAAAADLIFILVAYFGSQTFIDTLQNNIWISLGSGLAVVLFGVYYLLKSKVSGQFQRAVVPSRKRHFFLKGFFLNFFNVGVLFYWLATTLAIGPLLDNRSDHLIIFYALVLGFYLFIDLFKIYFAHKFKEQLQGRRIQMVEKILGGILILFGIFLILKNLLF